MGAVERFGAVRRVTVFLLGVAVIIEGLVSAQDRLLELLVGAVMVGVLPLDDLLRAIRGTIPRRDPGTDNADGP